MTYMLGAVGGQVLKTSTQLLQLLLVCDFVLAVLHKAMRSTAYQRKGHPRVDGLFVLIGIQHANKQLVCQVEELSAPSSMKGLCLIP